MKWKLSSDKKISWLSKMPMCMCTWHAHGLLQVAFMFFFPSPLVCNTMPCCLFYLFCFSFLFFFFFFFFLFLFWAVTLPFIFFWFFKVWATWFFFYMIFIFLINLGVCSFFCGYLSRFCFNWASFFKKGIWVNLFEHIFFIPPLFRSQPNKKKIK